MVSARPFTVGFAAPWPRPLAHQRLHESGSEYDSTDKSALMSSDATALARNVRIHTGYARANHEAHTLIRQALTGSGDIDPGDGTLTVRLDPLPTQRATTAIAQLCEHLTATKTRYPGTDLILRYEVKTRP